ncbi:trigger factor [Anaeromicrobium sediminis]|uniref:Trigger factor n=1 Tax=Anaeromicrobium sediminis TaxID=1478221 RepID=A0A267MIK0_9FIRM|nr:trigger factor [Anaeromicrobium sediminis]PAB58695.1 trigger factor [Anaeromicrobium sediminis]
MNSTFVKKENNEVTLKLNIPADDFNKAVDKAYKKMRGKFNIPGFRKGKAPKFVIENNYGAGIFYEEAINEIFPTAYAAAIDEHNLEPVDRPSLDVEEIKKGEDVELVVTVTVKPEVELGEYKGIEAEKNEYNVSDEDIEKEVEMLRERNSRLLAVERPVQDGDTVIIDYKGFAGDEQFEGGTAEKQTLVIGSGQFIPGFEEQLVGKNVGDELDVNVTFPTEYHAENLAGKEAKFEVKIHEVKEKELPELDDEFAKDVSEFDTLEELKADIKGKREEAAKNRVEAEYKDALVEKAVENAKMDIPASMIEYEIDEVVNQYAYQLQYQGLDLDTYLKYTNTTMDDLRNQMRPEGEKRVKTRLVLEKIVETENIEVSEEDVEKEMERYATQYKMELDKFKSTLRDADVDNIKDTLKMSQAVTFLADNAKKAE